MASPHPANACCARFFPWNLEALGCPQTPMYLHVVYMWSHKQNSVILMITYYKGYTRWRADMDYRRIDRVWHKITTHTTLYARLCSNYYKCLRLGGGGDQRERPPASDQNRDRSLNRYVAVGVATALRITNFKKSYLDGDCCNHIPYTCK